MAVASACVPVERHSIADNIDAACRFLQTAPRYRLAISSCRFEDCSYLEMGTELSAFLKSNEQMPLQSLRFAVEDEINCLFRHFTIKHPLLGSTLFLCNIGILFEPSLGIDVLRLLKRQSQNTMIVLHWEGEMDDKTLYFLTKQDKFRIDLSQTNHILLQ